MAYVQLRTRALASSCVASGRNRASKLNRYVSEELLTCLHGRTQ